MIQKMTLREAAAVKGEEIRKGKIGKCPNCGRWTWKFNWRDNMVHCPACNGDPGGGVLDYWAYKSGIDEPDDKKRHKMASRSIQEYYGNTSLNVIRKHKEEAKKEETICENEANLAPIKVRHRTYTRLLEYLFLSEEHRQNLLNRGLTDEDITRCAYRSMPNTSKERMCAEMIRDGYVLEGVPGFWKKDKKWVFGYGGYLKGILIPQRDSLGRIHGFQIRTDDQPAICKYCKCYNDGRCDCEESIAFKKRIKKNCTCENYKQDLGKYIALSSARKPSGTASGSFVHFAIHDYSKKIDYATTKVLLTEGPLKADIINALSNFDSPVLAIPGVSSTNYLEIALKELMKRGLKKIWVALDMDYEINPNVSDSLVNLNELLDKIGIEHNQYRWDLDEDGNWRGIYKGLDDWLARQH